MRSSILAIGLATTIAIVIRDGAAGPVSWADETSSPRPSGGDASILSGCRETDRALDDVAAQVATKRVVANDAEALTLALRAAGEPHVFPRAWLIEGRKIDLSDANARLASWLQELRPMGHLRCGVARSTQPGAETIAAVAVDAQADLRRMPLQTRTSSWVDVDARILVPAKGAKVVVLGPSGAPRALPTSLIDGRIRARASVDRPGAWLFQVVLDGDHGPRPALEALVFAGTEPPASATWSAVPGEEAGASSDPPLSLERMVTAARQSEALPPLTRHAALDRIARAHSERMMRTSLLAHEAGEGDPKDRVDRAGFAAREVGENVAHASTIVLAHRALWSSPSHRSNILERRFDQIGIGVVTAPDGTVWVTELFAR